MQSWLPSGHRNSPSASSRCHREVLQPLLGHPDHQKDWVAMSQPCHAWHPCRAECPSPSSHPPDSPSSDHFLLEKAHMALEEIRAHGPVEEIPGVLRPGTCLWRFPRDSRYIHESVRSILIIDFPLEKQSIQCTGIARANT